MAGIPFRIFKTRSIYSENIHKKIFPRIKIVKSNQKQLNQLSNHTNGQWLLVAINQGGLMV